MISWQIVPSLVLAALTVAPSDRLAMADRLFNRGDYAAARREYAALKGEKGVDEADVLYRLAASSEGLKDPKGTVADADAFLAKFASHRLADRVRLMKALASEGEARKNELQLLDRDDADPSLRAEALFHLARMSNDAALYERCRKLDPKGRYAAYASFYHASAALESADAAARRRGLAELMEIVYGKDAALAKDALYLAAVHSYREAKYGESAALLKRYQKLHPGDARLAEVRRLAALSELMGGHYAAALACCTDDKDDTLVFVKATANERMGNRDEALALARKYLEEFPQGRHRDAMELERARMEFDAAAKSGDKAKALDAAKRAVAFGKGAVARPTTSNGFWKRRRPRRSTRRWRRTFPARATRQRRCTGGQCRSSGASSGRQLSFRSPRRLHPESTARGARLRSTGAAWRL